MWRHGRDQTDFSEEISCMGCEKGFPIAAVPRFVGVDSAVGRPRRRSRQASTCHREALICIGRTCEKAPGGRAGSARTTGF
jgi:hypothetical protein